MQKARAFRAQVHHTDGHRLWQRGALLTAVLAASIAALLVVAMPAAAGAELPRPTKVAPLKIWFGGDSLSGVPGIAFARKAKATGVMRCTVDYQVSSRIVNDLTFNWQAHMRQVMAAQHPKAVIFMMGANEGGFSVTVNGQYLDFWRSGWRAYYRGRMAKMIQIMVTGGALRVYWVGMPMMGPAANSGMNNQMKRINSIARQELKQHPECRYIDAWKMLSRNGAYVDTYRSSDDIHLSAAGGDRLADAILATIKKEWKPSQ
jgi:uncharacterized protein